MKKKRILLVMLAFVMVFSMAITTGCGNDAPPAVGDNNMEGEAFTEVIHWRLASAWVNGTPLFDVCRRFTENVALLTNGNFIITPHEVNVLTPASGIFDLVQGGAVEVGSDWAGLWSGRSLGFDLLATSMFNFNGWDYYTWIFAAGGLEDAYHFMYNQFNMTYFVTNIVPPESGIKSNVPIHSIDDMRPLSIRMAGRLQGLVFEKLGLTPVMVAFDELYEALQRGVIDAAEVSNPNINYTMNIHEVTRYWLTPGWHQSASVYGKMINLDAYNALPQEYRNALRAAADMTLVEFMAGTQWLDAIATDSMINRHGLTTTRLSDEEMDLIQRTVTEAMSVLAAEDPNYAHVLRSKINFRRVMDPYRYAMERWSFGFPWEPENFPRLP